jgi:hypothetical protein
MTEDDFRSVLEQRAARPYPGAAMSGRGIVTCAGGARYFICAYVLVRLLRETLGCTLPIQLWHLGGEELSPAMRRLLCDLDVELVDAAAVLERYPADIRDGWQLKAYAIAYSRFEEVLFLDADQAPVRDPDFVFAWPSYLETGAVFWPDIIDIRADNPIWALVGLEGLACPSFESGQILVDKRRCWAALQVALLLNERADIVYGMIYGDKDTFLVAWRVTSTPFAMPPAPYNDRRLLVQRDFDGAPLFQHRTNCKWTYHASQYEPAGFQHMQACLGFLAELRGCWNGRMFFPPARSLAARAEEARLEVVARCELLAVCAESVEIILLPGSQIGTGRSDVRQNWFVEGTDEDLELILHDGDRTTYRFKPAGEGRWRGERLALPQCEAILWERDADQATLDAPPVMEGLLEALVDASGLHAAGGAEHAEDLIAALRLLRRAEPAMVASLELWAARADPRGEVARRALADREIEELRPFDRGAILPVMDTNYIRPSGPR